MNKKTLYEKAQLLKAGQIVEINADWFRAVKVEGSDIVACCEQCDLDSLCRDEVYDVCCEMETLDSSHWLLKLAHPL